MKTYFITGATGTIGAQLVPTLLRDEDSRVILLIRAQDEKHLDQRLETLFSFWEYPSAECPVDRIKAYSGDVSLPLLGMNPEDYENLSKECTHIIHSAGNVRMNLTLEEARRSSVESARNICALAYACQRHGNLKKVEFVSTVGVGGRMSGVLPETWITAKRSFHNTYEEAKAEAEAFIYRQIENGLPVTIHRPSMVVGDSKTGKVLHFQVFYHLCEFLSGRRTFGVLPRVEGTCLDAVPVDYVARMIAWSSNTSTTIGKVLHLCSGPQDAIPIEKLGHRIRMIFRSYGEDVPLSITVPLPFFKAALPFIGMFVSPHGRRAMNALPFFFDYLSEQQYFENRDTAEMTEAVGIETPIIETYLRKILSYYLLEKKR